MPDWTYKPLRGVAAALAGRRRSQRGALHTLACAVAVPGVGRAVLWVFGLRPPPTHLVGSVAGLALRSRLGAVVPPAVLPDAARALPALGAGLIEVSPVTLADVPLVAQAAAGRTVPFVVRSADPEVAAAVSAYVDAVVTGAEPTLIRLTDPSIAAAAGALARGEHAVLATPGVLLRAGPGWFARVGEATTLTRPVAPLRVGLDVRRWPGWWWGLLNGLGMIGAGLAAAAITLGPLLMWYDRDFLGTDRRELDAVDHHLSHFLQHDRITLAGTMVAIGVLYVGLAAGGMRRGWPWAREAFVVSGVVGFPTLFYFLATGFVEPLHIGITLVLFPMWLAAVCRRPGQPQWRIMAEGDERERRRALTGQLLLVITGVGLFVGGAVVSVYGLTAVFVPSDLVYLGSSAEALRAANPRLLPFIAHDRAGFGGALMAAAAVITLLSAWGWRRGEAWVWWTLAVAAAAGFGPAIAVHGSIRYTDFGHLAPVYFGIVLTVTALCLARPYLCAQATGPRGSLPDQPRAEALVRRPRAN